MTFGLLGIKPRGDVPVISDPDEDLEQDTRIMVSEITPDKSRRRRRRKHHRDDRNRANPPSAGEPEA